MTRMMIGRSVCPLAALMVGTLAPAIAVLPAMAADAPSVFNQVQVEEAEYRYTDDDEESFNWDAQAWIGGDVNKLALKSEGELVLDEEELEEAELQALYSRQISNFFDVVVGGRYDFEPEGEAFGVIGLQGLAPYSYEVDTALFISEDADVTARFEAEYEILVTQKLVLQPSLETNLNFEEVGGSGLGFAFDDVELGLRLRYEIIREIAPYVGVNWERALGDAADELEDEGETVDSFAGVAGIRFWF
ncbi:MAG: copper resistance protein B [Geminicoccales bacterium]